MKALQLYGINDLRLVDIEKPQISGKQLLLKVKSCGICGSDIPRTFKLGTKVNPVTLGHEFAGEIVDVADDNDKNLIGKHAAIFNIIPCMNCDMCKHGDYAHCDNISYLGTRINGGFAEYCVIPSRFNVVVCENEKIPFTSLAMTEPTSVALHALRRSKIQFGETLLIFGAGPIGLLIAKWADVFGVAKTTIVDIDPQKVEFARTLGFDALNSHNDDFIHQVMDRTNGKGYNIVIEGTGSSGALNNAIESISVFGKLVFLGNSSDDTTILCENHSLLLRKELTMMSVWNSYYCDSVLNEWKYAIHMISEKKMDPSDLITHRIKLEDAVDVFEKIYRHEIFSCKVLTEA